MASIKRLKYASIARGNDKKAIGQLSKIAETMIGATGDGMEKAVTFRDLQDLGAIKVTRGPTGNDITYVNSDDVTAPTSDPINTPTIPTGVTVAGGYSSIMIMWDFPIYGGHAYTEVWRSSDNVLGNASLLITTNSTSYGDFPGTDFSAYYWVRHVNSATPVVKGPYNDTSGLFGETSINVDFAIELLEGQIGTLHLNTYLGGVIGGVPAIQQTVADQQALLGSLSGAFDSNGDGTIDLNERLVSLQSQVTTAKTVTENGFLTVTDGLLISAGDNEDVFEEVGQILGKVLALENVLIDPDTGFTATRAVLLNEYYTKTTADEAIALSSKTLLGEYYDPDTGELVSMGSISNVYEAIVNNTDNIVTRHIVDYQIEVDGVSAGLTEWAEVSYNVDAKFEAQWGFKATVGELTGGIGFVNNGDITQFVVESDRFAIINPRTDTLTSMFIAVANDPVLPDGVYIDAAFIKVANIAELVVGEVNADTVTAGISIDTPKIDGGEITGSSIALVAGAYTLEIIPESPFPFWFGSSSVLKTKENSIVSFGRDGKTYMKGLEIRSADNTLVVAANGEIDGAFIKNLTAESIDGDVVDRAAVIVSSDFEVSGPNTYTLIEGNVAPGVVGLNHDRLLVVSGICLDHQNGSGSRSHFDVVLYIDDVQSQLFYSMNVGEEGSVTPQMGAIIPAGTPDFHFAVKLEPHDGNNILVQQSAIVVDITKQGSTLTNITSG
jgi:hypothetical protein